MPNNANQNPNDPFDDFEQAQLEEQAKPAGPFGGLAQLWRDNPLVKLGVVMAGVALLVGLSMWLTAPAPKVDKTTTVKAPDLQEAPGGEATPAFNQAVRERATLDTVEALKTGGSAIPPPQGQELNLNDPEVADKPDPMAEFRAEIERLRAEQQQQQQVITQQQQVVEQQQQGQKQFDEKLADKMAEQMTAMLESWKPTSMKVVEGTVLKQNALSDSLTGGLSADNSLQPAAVGATGRSDQPLQPAIIPAGTVNYGQMLIEANSDVPGPIMAQVLSGPFSGGRAIGKFQYLEDYLIISFTNINHKGIDYPVQALALDPNTTLGGMATETNKRYFSRVVLPAAAAFASGLGDALGGGNTTVTTVGDATVVSKGEQGLKDGMFEGLGEAANSVGRFLEKEADKTKPLVVVAAGTPLGLFFVQSVYSDAAKGGRRTNPYTNAVENSSGFEDLMPPSVGTSASPTTRTNNPINNFSNSFGITNPLGGNSNNNNSSFRDSPFNRSSGGDNGYGSNQGGSIVIYQR